MYVPNLGLVEAAEAPRQVVHVMSQQGVDLLKRAAISEEVNAYVICDPHPSVSERLTIADGEAAICINGLESGVRGASSKSPGSRVMRAAMREAENIGIDLIDPEWFENMELPKGELRMSKIGLNPMGHGWDSSVQYPKNGMVQRRAAAGLIHFMGTRSAEDLIEVENSLLSDGGKSWNWEMSVPSAVWDGTRVRAYLRDNPNDLKGAFHSVARALFSPWNR